MDNVDFYLYDLKTKFNKINPKEYYLSYSGGKDSHLLYWFIKEYAPEFKDIKVVGINTYMEHAQIRKRIYDNSDEVLLPTKKPFEIKEKYGIPCFSKEQDFYIYYYQKAIREGKTPAKTYRDKINGTYHTGFNISKTAREYILSGKAHKITHLCCYYLKKKPAHDFEKASCFSKNGKFTPLWDLTEELEDEIYEKYKIEIPSVYSKIKRTGCMGCPYGSWKGDVEKELDLISDVQRNFVCEYFKESYKALKIKV